MVRRNYFATLFTALISTCMFAQQGVHGALVVNATTIVNEYTSLTASAPAGSTSLTVANATLNANGRFPGNLAAGDLIMVYQVQGVFFLGSNFVGASDTTWGKIPNPWDYRNCGLYELVQVSSVAGNVINIDCALRNSYNYTPTPSMPFTMIEKTVVVRVPRYTTLTINNGGILTCDDWNGTIGGVLAVEVQGNTVINAGGSIDATGRGFRGGSLVGDNATAFGVNTTYSTNNSLGAEKGEGVGGYQSELDFWGGRYCRAPAVNGGGGGDGHNAGGGGGANALNSTSGTAIWSGNGIPDQSQAAWTTAWSIEPPAGTMNLRTAANSAGGGRGGYTFSGSNQNATTVPPGNGAWGGDARNHEATGLGGRPLSPANGRVYLGGGGGAGDQNNSGGGIGGDGGGFIYIMCFGNVSGGGALVSNGTNGANGQGGTGMITGIDAGGGGGAGGSIVVNAIGTVANTLTLTTTGGNGGNQVINLPFSTNEGEGPGGGGGGGYIAVSNGAPTRNASGGNNGTTNSAGVTEFIPNGATRGCPGTNNALVLNYDITLTNQTICAGQTATITPSVTGAPPPGYDIRWYNASTGGAPFFTGASYTTPVLAVGTYTYWVAICGGWWREPVTITVVGAPTVTSNASFNPICSGSSTTLTASGSATSYVWNPGNIAGTSIVVSPGSTQTYTVTGTLMPGGCTATSTITVTVTPTPTVTATASSVTICNGQSTTLTGGGATTYVWNPGNISGSPISVSPGSSTTYTVTGTTSGCSGTAQVAITVNPLPNVGVSASANPICSGNSTTLTGSGANTYAWMPGSLSGTSVVVSPPTGNTTYTVTGTNSGTGCTNTAQLTVTVNPTPTVTATASTLTICNGQSTTLTGSGATSYVWNPGSLSGTSVVVSPSATQAYTVTGTTGTCSNTFVITVTVNPTPTVTSVASTNPICAGASTSLTAGGASTYVWNPGSLPGSPVSVSPGSTQTYTVTGTAANGCTSTSQLTVTVNPLPTVTSSASTNPICVGGSTTLTGGGASTYVWNPGSIPGSPINVAPASTQTYTLTGTDGNGCSNTSQITVTVVPQPTVTATANTNPICAGSPTTLTASGATSYNWMPGSLSGTSITVSPASTTAFTVTGTSGTCTSSFVITVTVNPTPTVSSTAGTNPICAGASTSLSASGASTYVWNPGAIPGSPVSVSPVSTTTYTVTGTDGNGCTSTSQITVTVNPVPTISAAPSSAAICAGSSVTITMSGAPSYSWMPGSLTGSSETLSPASTTTYTITGTDGNGCTDTAQVIVTVNTLPTVTASSAPTTICAGESATLTSGGASTYVWNPGSIPGSPVVVTPASTTTYTVTGTDGNGCTDTATATVIVNPLPVPTASAVPPTICMGDTVQLSAGGGTTYTWNGGNLVNASGSAQVDNPSGSTTYSVVVSDANGCVDSTTIAVTVNPLPTADAGPDQTVCAGTTVSMFGNGGVTYTWNGGSLSNANGSSQSDTPPVTTDYELMVTDANGCTDLDTVTINVNALPVVGAGPDVQICINSSTVLNGSGASSYVWTPAGSLDDDSIASPTASPVVTTTYVVVGTDINGCSDDDTVVVTIGNNLTVFASNDITICPGDSALLTIVGGTIWNWTPTATLDNPTNDSTNAFPTSTTTYTVNVQDANGCAGVDSVTVFINSSVSVGVTAAPTTICIGQSASLTATPSGGTGPYTYIWSDSTLTGPGPNSVSPTVTTVYTVTVVDSIGCSSLPQTTTVTVNPPLTLNAINPASACVGGTANLTASGSGGDNNLTYTWYPGAMTGASQTVTVSSTQTYTVYLTDGCGTPADSQMVTVTANQPPTVSLTSDVNTGCAPLCVNFTGTSSGTCSAESWNFGDNTTSTQSNPNHCYNTSGSYDVIYTCTDGNGCVGSDTVTGMITVSPNPTASMSIPNVTVQLNGGQATVCVTDQSTGATSWSYQLNEPNGTQTSTLQSPCFTVTDTGAYSIWLTVQNADGCTDYDSLVFFVDWPCNELFVPSAFSPNGDGMNDTFFVYGNCISFMQLEIYSRWGEQVFITTTSSNGWDGTWRGKPCESAVFTYVLRGQMDDGTPLEMQGNITLTR